MREYLQSWGGNCEVFCPAFYFWRAGTSEQRCLNGLIRSILHQIVSYKPSLICTPDRKLNAQAWTTIRLKDTFYDMIAGTSSLKFCIFVDGLDEFEGDLDTTDDMLHFIHRTAQSSNVKIVVSSRPEPPLVKSLATWPTLRLQDLTWRDIYRYVYGRLEDEDGAKELISENNGSLKMLEQGTVNKADGVFLWAKIAVQDLLIGIRAMDTIKMLEERLEVLDRSLDGMFA